IKYVGIERRNGRERVVIDFDRVPSFRVIPGATGPARMEIDRASLSPEVPGEIRGAGEGAVVHGVRVAASGGKVWLSVERSSGGNATAIREGNRIVWMFAAEAAGQDKGRAIETVAREAATNIDGEEVAAFLSDVPLQVGVPKSDSRYSGRRIDLD